MAFPYGLNRDVKGKALSPKGGTAPPHLLPGPEKRWPEEIHLFVCAFEDPASFAPKAHVYVSEQLPWLHLADGLPRHDKTS